MTYRNRSRRLSMESLESREPLAGNVLASLQNGNLVVAGDHADNSVQVRLGPATVYVSGENTLVNGSRQRAEFPRGTNGFQGGLIAQMKGGNDKVIVLGWNDPHRVDAAFISLEMGPGSLDRVSILDSHVARSVDVTTGPNSDDLTIARLRTGGDLNITANGGRDIIDLSSLKIGGNLNVSTGDGNDYVAMGAPGGLANRNTIGGRISIDTGAGRDDVYLRRLSADQIFVSLGDGDDRLDLGTETKVRRITAPNGGAGYDRLKLHSSVQTGSLIAASFEQRLA